MTGDVLQNVRSIGQRLLELATLSKLQRHANVTIGPLHDILLDTARDAIITYDVHGRLDADKHLMLLAVEFYHMNHSAKGVASSWSTVYMFDYHMDVLRKETSVALRTQNISTSQVNGIRIPLEELLDLQTRLMNWKYHDLTKSLATDAGTRADDITRAMKLGYQHDPEPVLHLLQSRTGWGVTRKETAANKWHQTLWEVIGALVVA
ncbi:hypothetical protein LTR17_008361 [Elasticomyces elasticus]|nr:hypothetical protein LTR17_008361 [Elasticomyces elasticus]